MSSDKQKVAYLVVCWNNRKIIDECLQSLQQQTYKNTVVYVIDNDSSDGSAEYIEQNYPSVLLTKHDQNSGFSRGNNLLIHEALKDKDVGYVALINSDAVLDKDWTKNLIDFLKDKSHFAGAQGLTLDYYDHDIVDAEYIYVEPNFQSVQYGYGKSLNETEHKEARRVFGVNAAAAIFSRHFIEDQPENVLFDEKYYMYLEDMDVALRSVITGWENYFVPSARAYHMGSVSSKKRSNGYNIKMTFRNQAALLYKHLPYRVFKNYLLAAIKFERHFYIHLIKTHGYKTLWMAVTGRIVGILRLPLYTRDRKRLMKKRTISSEELERIIKNRGEFS